jgi:hypothetical protein
MRSDCKCHYDNRNKDMICMSKICMRGNCAVRFISNLLKEKVHPWYGINNKQILIIPGIVDIYTPKKILVKESMYIPVNDPETGCIINQ